MGCLKCGRDTAEDQVFCSSCLEIMERYPVKPNIAIQLPQKADAPVSKRNLSRRKQPPSAEEKIQRLKRRLKTVVILWLITLALLAAAIYPTVQYFIGQNQLLPGQNYSTIINPESTTP